MISLFGSRTLLRGLRGADVLALRNRLVELGYLEGKQSDSFDATTEAAVKNFQQRSNLKVDGKVGKQTKAMLSIDPAKPSDVAVVRTPKTPAQYAAKFRAAMIQPAKLATVSKRAALLLKHKDRYAIVAKKCLGISELWWVVACIHNQESGSDVGVFKACLHNGERIIGTGKKTSLVPAGRGPFATWEEAAIDALFKDGANKRKAWDIGSALEFFERYNGLGYRNKGVESPYVWAMTDQYVKGHYGEKVGADGKPHSTFYPNSVSKNYGVAAIIKALGVIA